MTKKVFSIDTLPGVQRDGTFLDKNYYTDGRWVRFQRGRPRKMGGYREITANLAGPSRGIFVNPQTSFNNVFSGYSDGLQKLPIDNNGVGGGIVDMTLSDFTPDVNNLWQFDGFTDTTGSGNNLLLAHPGQNLSDINNDVNTPVLGGPINGNVMSKIGVFTLNVTTTTGLDTFIVGTTEPVGAGQTIISTAFPTGTVVVSNVGGTITVDQNATSTGAVDVSFDNNVDVSGGVVSLHPYVFVYGNDGLIKNCAAGNTNDWVSADANEVNVATGKIVQGLAVRGGSNAPSGLFWSLDSLIRVSYNPTTVTVGGSPKTLYWRYDIISTQSSILSSQCVIEYDGIYYWVGVDRFLLYNGVVKEIPNNMNQNYFFDNLNYAQRQKVWVSKVPRFGEIWWFYPRGDSTECNDAIVYNIRENCWYDAGVALGSRRSDGYFSQVFHFPIAADWQINAYGGVNAITFSAGSGYTDGTYTLVPLTGGAGTGAAANIEVLGGAVVAVEITLRGTGYEVGDVLTASIPAGAGFDLTVDSLMNFVSLYQHEIGTDSVQGLVVNAIESYFETSDIGWVNGGPTNSPGNSPPQGGIGDNVWFHIERVEPDFVQSGTMTLEIVGRPYAQADDKVSDPYYFDPDTHKIDMREQRRECRLRFTSNVAGGNYQLGKVLVNANVGDVRGY